MPNTSTDYTGRRVDMSTFTKKVPETPQRMGFADPGALVIAGPLKASQNYARVFLSAVGERKERPEFGTGFGREVSGSNMAFPVQIVQSFHRNNIDALAFLKSNYPTETPPDERVVSATLLNYNLLTSSSIELEIEITTGAGESSSFLLPLNI